MADYNKQKYYWIKLTDHFLTSDTVDFLLSQKDGANYVVLYQMLCLKCVNTDGLLARRIGEVIIPFDIDKITRDCRHFSVDTVRVALELYKKLGLVYEQSDGYLRIAEFDRLIGSQTEGARRKEIQLQNRLKLKESPEQEQGGGTEGGKKVEKIPPEIKILDIRDKEIRDKEIRDEGLKKENLSIKESDEDKPRLGGRHKYGQYKNVLLSEEEYDKLHKDYENADEAIEYLSEYIEMKGYKVKSYYLAMKKWVFRAIEEDKMRDKKINSGNKKDGIDLFREMVKSGEI